MQAAVTDLFNKSMMPHILMKLLGGGAPYRQGSGQLALRFPGDACVGDGCECPPEHFEGVRKGCAFICCQSLLANHTAVTTVTTVTTVTVTDHGRRPCLVVM
jgi:uncharacterized Zn-binding protein involved in type VI secretion